MPFFTHPQAGPFASLESLLSAVVDSSHDGIISKTLEGIILSWNRGAESIFGYTADEIVGRPVTTLIPPDRQGEESEILRRLRNGEKVEHYDTVRVRRDGRTVDVSLTISPVRNEEGVIVGASKIVRVVSDRKRAEEALRAEKAKLEIINQVGMALASERDLDKLVQVVTDAGARLIGASCGTFAYARREPGDSEGVNLAAHCGASREGLDGMGTLNRALLFGRSFEGEGVVRIDDVLADPRFQPGPGLQGEVQVRSYMAVAVVSRSQEVVGGLCFGHPEPGRFPREAESHIAALAAQASIAIDNARLYTGLQEQLDQQRQMATALRESEELSSSILNSTADCIKVLDLQGNLLYMNPPGLALFGIEDFEPLRGMPWPLLWPEEMRPKLLAAIGVALEGELGKFEGCCPTKEGAPKWWDVIVSPLKDAMGTVTKLTATSRDITDRHVAAEQALQAAEEIARQNRMKDEFLATLSHELRTPLQSIMGWTQILIGGGFDQAELAQGLEVIDRNAHAQTRIIEDLLDMSRILSGKVRLDVQKVELSHLIEAALDSVRPAAQAKGITLQSILDPLARPVSGDPGRLQQVFWNLLSNAIKFTPRGGKVQVLLERVNSHLEVSIADNGAGIDPEFLPHVFERFKQADASITRRHGGLGLGLAIVKHLVELHGGSVRVKSPGPGLGATFSISFPLAPVQVDSFDKDRRHPDGRESSRAGGDLPRLDGVRILAVDDEPDARNLLAVMLRKAGAEVITCGSAAEALSLIPGLLPQVLISDVGMSPVDGYSLIQAVRKLPEEQGGGLAAIALTAYTRSEDRIKAIASGFQVHLAKPAHAMELLTMVRSLSKASRVSGEN